MAGEGTTVSVAQAADGDALQQGVVVQSEVAQAETPAAAGEHTTTETHAATEAHSEVFPPFDPSGFGGQLLWLAITFAALYIVLSRAALPRIGGIIEMRRTRIEGDLKEADRLRQETERAAEAYQSALAEARRDAQKIAEETRNGIRTDIDNKRKTVESDLSARMKEAEARIEQTKTAALANVDAIAADTAKALVERLSGKVGDAEARAAVAQVKG